MKWGLEFDDALLNHPRALAMDPPMQELPPLKMPKKDKMPEEPKQGEGSKESGVKIVICVVM
jgi:hypothetical protein